MTDSTEQFAEIMNKTIQEAVDAEERADVAEAALAAAVARAVSADTVFSQLLMENMRLTHRLEDAAGEVEDLDEEKESLLDLRDQQADEIKQLKAQIKELNKNM